MGWKTTFFAAFLAVAAVFSFTTKPADAANGGWLMCWVPSDSLGASDCRQLPSSWRIRGVHKAYCTSGNYYCSRSSVSFRINRSNLRHVARYAPVSTRDYGVTVTIYSGRYR